MDEKEKILDRWGVIDFDNVIFNDGIRDARQQFEAREILGPGGDEFKAHKILKQETFAWLDKELNRLAKRSVPLTPNAQNDVVAIGVNLCLEKSNYADTTHLKRWLEMAERLRDLWRPNHQGVAPEFNWADLAAFYMKAKDMYLQACFGRPKAPPLEEEEGESSG